MIIRYCDLDPSNSNRPEKLTFEYATLLPQTSRNHGTTRRRWILSRELLLPDIEAAKRSAELISMAGEPCGVLSHDVIRPLTNSNPLSSTQRTFDNIMWGQSNSNRPNATQNNDLWGGLPVLPPDPVSLPQTNLNFEWDTFQRFFRSDKLKASLRRDASFQFPQELDRGWESAMSHPFQGAPCHYQFIFGNPSSAAIFKRNVFGNSAELSPIRQSLTAKAQKPLTEIPIEDVLRLLRTRKLDRRLISVELSNLGSIASGDSNLPPSICSDFRKSVRALELISVLYKGMSNATIDLGVTTKPLALTRWADDVNARGLTHHGALSAISYFETGFIDLQPSHFDGVFALSMGNSLFISDCLLHDPWDRQGESAVRRVIGNVGKPGLSLLLSPQIPKVKESDLGAWSVINHDEFNGKLEGNFSDTSLHLSLTGYNLPIKMSHGSRGQDASYVEAVVSAYDRGVWVADLDIPKALGYQANASRSESGSSRNIQRQDQSNASSDLWMMPERCLHPNSEDWTATGIGPLTSIDNWDEFLDPPMHIGVVRATGSWSARMALTAVARQRGFTVIIAPELIGAHDRSICWYWASSRCSAIKAVDPDARILILC